MKFIKSKKGLTLLATLTVAVVAAVGAYAYFTSSGTGSGSATVGTDAGLTVTQTGTAPSGMLPGGADQDINIHVANPAAFQQKLSALTVAVKNANGTTWTAVSGCSAADFSITQPTVTPVVLAKSGDAGDSADYVAKIHMVDASGNQDGCKLANVPLYFSAS